MNYCDKCGGPLRNIRSYDEGWLTMGGCRLCWLEEVVGDTTLWAWSGTEEAANSTADSPATSTWLPLGACLTFRYGPPPVGGTSDEWRLRRWHQMAEIRQREERYEIEDKEDRRYWWRTGQDPPVPFNQTDVAAFREAFMHWASSRL